MIGYYLITTILALLNLTILIFKFEEKRSLYYVTIIEMLMAVACAGYLALALSTNLTEAILAKKIYYLGGCFIPPVLFFAMCTICNFKIVTWVRNLLYAYSFIVYGFILTIGYNDLYYTNIRLGKFYNATTLEYEYGFAHTFFDVILYGYMVVELVILIYCLYKKYSVSHKILWAFIMLEVVNTLFFIVGRYLDAGFEVMPLLYVVDGWIFLYIHRRITMYSIEDSIISSLGKQNTYGYILLDRHMNYLGCNDVVKGLIPEIVNCKVDLPVKNIPQMETILNWVNDAAVKQDEVFSYEVEDKHYQCTVENLWYKDKACGYIIEMQEDTDRWNYLNLLSSYSSDLEKQVEEKTEHISNIQSQILVGMADMMENRDDNTGGHIRRTSDVIRILVEVIQEKQLLVLSEQFCKDIIKAAPLHDLGKIGIGDKILCKPGRLTEEEFAIMQTHTVKSAELVESIFDGVEEEHFVKIAMNVARHHHEKWNGCGYPDGLKGEEIPLEARIMAIADVYDALVSKRCYKEPMSFEAAAKVMLESMGSHFDPNLEQVFWLSRIKLEHYYKGLEN